MNDSSPSPVACPACGKSYRWREAYAGKAVRCQCGQAFVMPAASPAAASEVARPPVPSPSAPPRAAVRPAAPVAAPSTAACPACKAPLRPGAVICVACGYNLQEGKQLKTQTGGVVRAATGPTGKPRHVTAPDPEGFFARIQRGWQFAKISYGILWDFKQLMLFPVFSVAASILVTASFFLPLWGTGTLSQFSAFLDHKQNHVNPLIYVLAFVYYFCCYFVIVFFNTALTACAMKVTAGEAPTIKYGLSVAVKRLPQIIAWSLLSAVVGLLLKIVENAHEKAGRIVAAILGSAWTVLTYFVIPALVVEGVGPLAALKRSVSTLRETWGDSLTGNAAMGAINFLLLLPILALIAVGVFLSLSAGSLLLFFLVIGVGLGLLLLWATASSAADGVLKALLYNYATGRSMPADIDQDVFTGAFASRGLA